MGAFSNLLQGSSKKFNLGGGGVKQSSSQYSLEGGYVDIPLLKVLGVLSIFQ